MSARRQSGFTLLELLVVIGIIAILSAIAVVGYMMAINRARQKRTVSDMRTIAAAWEARATDTHSFAAGGYTFPAVPVTAPTLQTALSPTYLRQIPRYDGWGRAFEFAMSADGKEYAIRSRGRDGAVDSAGQLTPGETPDSDCDIIYANGSFVTYPAVAQTK